MAVGSKGQSKAESRPYLQVVKNIDTPRLVDPVSQTFRPLSGRLFLAGIRGREQSLICFYYSLIPSSQAQLSP